MIQKEKGKERNIYKIEEEDEKPLYNIEDLPEEEEEEEEHENPDEEKPEKKSVFSILIKIMLTPVEGWKALKRNKYRPDEMASACFYPLIALAAISVAANFYYDVEFTFTDWVENGLSTFITFFFGYFTVIFLGAEILPKKSRPFLKEDIGKEFVMANMSTLAMFYCLIQLLPMIEPVLVFLPIWTIYLIYKGIRVYHVNPEEENTTTVWLCILIIGAPVFWNWIFTEFLLPTAGY